MGTILYFGCLKDGNFSRVEVDWVGYRRGVPGILDRFTVLGDRKYRFDPILFYASKVIH